MKTSQMQKGFHEKIIIYEYFGSLLLHQWLAGQCNYFLMNTASFQTPYWFRSLSTLHFHSLWGCTGYSVQGDTVIVTDDRTENTTDDRTENITDDRRTEKQYWCYETYISCISRVICLHIKFLCLLNDTAVDD